MELRQALHVIPSWISGSTTHATLAGRCQSLGLPTPPSEDQGSKFERASASFTALADTELPKVAQRVLASGELAPADRNSVQDALWAGTGHPGIPKRTRREIARDVDLGNLIHDERHFTRLLDSLWLLDDYEGLTGLLTGRRSLRDNIVQHVYRNPDWSAEKLFDRLGAFDASDRRFAVFLEGLASADVVPDIAAQRRFVGTVNPHLNQVGVELRETGQDGGYPVFSVVSTPHTPRQPEEPDLRLAH